MKIKLTALIPVLATFLFASAANAQNHNSPAGKGLNGQQPLGVYTDGATAVNDTVGAWGRYAVSENGAMYCSAVDGGSGLSQSVVPNSLSEINGPMTMLAGLSRTVTDTAETGSTTTVINATSHSVTARNWILFYSGNASGAASPVCSVTANTITLCNALPAAPANGDTFRAFYPVPPQVTIGTSGRPALAVVMDQGDQSNSTTTLLKLEDAAHSSGDAGVAVFQRLLGTGQAGSSGGTANDYVTLDGDVAGRLMINPWGQNTGNFGSTCGTATASTSNVEIVAAVASNRIYVSGVTCSSSDADNATNINFKDGTTVVAVGGVSQMATSSAGTFTANFNPPLRGTVNTAFNFNTAVSTSSVICCATYFTSTV